MTFWTTGGQFPIPAISETPLLALRCTQAIRPYLPGDKTDGPHPAILIDTPVVYSHIDNAKPISEYQDALDVKVFFDDLLLAQGTVPLNAAKYELPFSLAKLESRSKAYNISCIATSESQRFEASSLLTYLPDPPSSIGSVTKVDLRTGALLARPADGKAGPYSPVFPIGFFTNFKGYLDQNLSIPAELASQGFTVIHPIPSFDNFPILEEVLDAIQAAGLYLMYDFRGPYTNLSSVAKQVNLIKSRPNLLLWYTADEPDGFSNLPNALVTASNLISLLDGGDGQGGAGYHPISLVLNCQNYYFAQYASGADIVMQDAYTVSINATWSTVWETPCTVDYGDCGCDNCKGSFQDISTRMDEFRQRFFVNGWERTKTVWTVPQAFGESTYWPRYPTGHEFVVQSIVGINHGGFGVISWNDPTPTDIKPYTSKLAISLKQMTPYILSPSASFRQVTIDGVDCALWTVNSQTLVLATSTKYATETVTFASLGLRIGVTVAQVLDTGSSLTPAKDEFIFTSVGSGGFIAMLGEVFPPCIFEGIQDGASVFSGEILPYKIL